MTSLKITCAVMIGLLCGSRLWAQDDEEPYGPQPAGAAEAKTRYEAALKEHEGAQDKLVLPGLVADRKAQRVELLVECTGLPGGDVAEFLLVDSGSSHGYEALLWSWAKPSDIHRALEFIGLRAGTPQNPALPRLWSDGSRVSLEIESEEGDHGVPIEELVVDHETEQPLEAEGFVFSGSFTVPARDDSSKVNYVADVYDPRSVASLYNDRGSVLDVPRQVTQGEAYGNHLINPDYAFEGGTLLTVVMTPMAGEGEMKSQELKFSMTLPPHTNSVLCSLTGEDGAVLEQGHSLSAALERLVGCRKEGIDSYVTLSFGRNVPVAVVAKSCVLLAMMENMGMARIRPPAEGELFHRAFIPNKAWYEPDGRPMQPWELHLSLPAKGDMKKPVTAQMVWNEPIWSKERTEPTFKQHLHDVADPAAMRALLDQHAAELAEAGKSALPPVLLIFADAGLPYGTVQAFAREALSDHGTLYVFVEEPEETTP